jgi:hypothetical protein
MLKSQAAVEEVISYMDEYYLGKEDWDAFVELGVDTMKEELILKKIPTATKSAFTRQYVPFSSFHQHGLTTIGTIRETIQSHSTRETCLQRLRRFPIKVQQRTTRRSLRYVFLLYIRTMLTM